MGGQRAFAYIPGLDGLRALAVLAVLCFHAQVGTPGGFLGVSVFFTLSGYLITSLLLAEHSAGTGISLKRFYGRRLRRLLPASYACLVSVLIASRWLAASQRSALRGDLLAALSNVANWRFALGSRSYQDLFIGRPSPLAHFWSLSIEEQWYLVLPLVVVIALRWGRRALAGVVATLFAASLIVTLATRDADLVYNGTHTRAAELLAGAGLALVLPRVRASVRAFDGVGFVSLGVLAVLCSLASTADRWLYRGGFVAVALVSATLIGAIARGTALAGLLSRRPLVALGRVSYGVYLFHWPVFLLLDEHRLGLGRPGVLLVRLVVLAVVTVASYRLVELPVRLGQRFARPAFALFAGGAALVAIAVAAVFAIPRPNFTETEQLLAQGGAGYVQFSAHRVDTGGLDTSSKAMVVAPGIGSVPTVTPPRRPVILVVGSDSTPGGWLAGSEFDVVDGTQPNCAVATADEVLLPDGTVHSDRGCVASAPRWLDLVDRVRPDLVVVSVGRLDRGVVHRPGDAGFPADGDIVSVAQRWTAAERDLDAAIGGVEAQGLHVVVADGSQGAGSSFYDEILARVDLGHPAIDGISTTKGGLLTAVRGAAAPSSARPSAPPLRVLVTGDSTSLNLARALSDGSDGALQVVWAGENGCPFARVEATRVSDGGDWQPNHCAAFDRKLPPVIEDFHPQIVLLVVSVEELTTQRYVGDPTPHAAGDAQFAAFHDAEIGSFVTMLQGYGVPLLIADSPGVHPGGFATAEMANPDRLAAWNQLVASWGTRWASVGVFDYAGPLLAAEAKSGSIRPDGVHPEIGPLSDIARSTYVPAVVAQVSELSSKSDLLGQDSGG